MITHDINTFQEELKASGKIPIFEFEVIDKRNTDKTLITFRVAIDTMDKKVYAEHEALTQEEEDDEHIAFKHVDFDDCFSLDEHLQELYAECYNALVLSEFYELRNKS